MWRHILPNAMVATLTYVPFILSGSVTILSSLDFLGFGLPPGSPSLGELVAQGLWPEAVRKLAPVRLALRRLDPALAVRLPRALYSLVLREATGLGYREGQNMIKGFTKAAEPLPVDRLALSRFRGADVEKTRKFYGEIMGFEEVHQAKDKAAQTLSCCFKVNDDQFLGFVAAKAGGEPFRLERMSFLSPDLTKTRAWVAEHQLDPGPIEKDEGGTLS